MSEVMKWITDSMVVCHMVGYQLCSVWGRVLWKQTKLSMKRGFHGYLVWLTKVEVKCEYCGILYDDQYTAAVIHNFSRESCNDVSIGD